MNEPVQICHKCGAPLAEDARFCEECGAPVAATASAINPPTKATLRNTSQPATKKMLLPALLVAGLIGVVIFGCLIALAVRQFAPLAANPTQASILLAGAQTDTVAVSPTVAVTAANYTPEVSVPNDMIETAPALPTFTASADTPIPAALDPQSGWYDFESVAFSYDPTLAALIETETVSAQTGNNLPPWELYPEHRVLSLRGYPLSETFHKPKIIIYPAQEYLAINPAIGDQVANLQQMLIGRRTDFLPDPMPFFTVWNAGQMIASQVKFLDFRNGSGVRYLTQYGQGISPFDNQHLFYTFQGITNDKKWLVSAILPVSNLVLPDPDTLLADPGFIDNFAAYIDSTRILLNDLPDSSYIPNLTLLDGLFQSLEIQP